MQPNSPMMAQGSASTTLALAQNRVLRNTYWLLALSLVPTVLGAWVGIQMKFAFFPANPAIGFIAFLESQRHEDDSTSLKWVEVQYGDDRGETRIVRDSDERTRSRALIRP